MILTPETAPDILGQECFSNPNFFVEEPFTLIAQAAIEDIAILGVQEGQPNNEGFLVTASAVSLLDTAYSIIDTLNRDEPPVLLSKLQLGRSIMYALYPQEPAGSLDFHGRAVGSQLNTAVFERSGGRLIQKPGGGMISVLSPELDRLSLEEDS